MTVIISLVLHLSDHISSLMTGVWLGMFCVVSRVTPWPYLSLIVLQPGLPAQYPTAQGIFLKVVLTTVPPCFLEAAPGHRPCEGNFASWWEVWHAWTFCGRCWASVRAHGCVLRGLEVWWKVSSNPIPGDLWAYSLIYSTHVSLASTTRWGEHNGE